MVRRVGIICNGPENEFLTDKFYRNYFETFALKRAIFKEKAPIFSIEALDTISDGLLLGVELRDTVLVTCFDDVAL